MVLRKRTFVNIKAQGEMVAVAAARRRFRFRDFSPTASCSTVTHTGATRGQLPCLRMQWHAPQLLHL